MHFPTLVAQIELPASVAALVDELLARKAVTRELGTGALPGLIAAASLLTDYVLTVAVSIASGVLAVTSAVPELASHAVALSLAVLVIAGVADGLERGLVTAACIAGHRVPVRVPTRVRIPAGAARDPSGSP